MSSSGAIRSERMPAGLKHFSINRHDQRRANRRAADPDELALLHADAVIHQHVGQLFQSGIAHGRG